MKKILYFCIFVTIASICLYDSYITLSKTSIPVIAGLAIISMSIGIFPLLFWLEFKEIALALGIIFWIIPLANAFEMSKDGSNFEEISLFFLSRIAMGIVFYFAVYESVEIAKSEFKEKSK